MGEQPSVWVTVRWRVRSLTPSPRAASAMDSGSPIRERTHCSNAETSGSCRAGALGIVYGACAARSPTTR